MGKELLVKHEASRQEGDGGVCPLTTPAPIYNKAPTNIF